MRKKVTVQDIANTLGVSRNTVSKALNNHESIANSTKMAILKIAMDMGYQKLGKPIPMGNLVKKTQNLVTITHRHFVDISYWTIVFKGIEEAVSQAGYNLMFSYIKDMDEENLVLPQSIISNNVDGIIIAGTLKIEYLRQVLKTGIPVVYIDASIDMFSLDLLRDTILMENESSTYRLTRHLIEQGHTEIGFFGNICFCLSYQERWLGYKRAMEDAGFGVDHRFCLIANTPGTYQVEDEVVENLDKLVKIPTAMVCANDRLAIFVMKALKQKGYKIPEDIAVTGFDNIHEAVIVEPHLTTVKIPKEELGKRAVEELFWRMKEPERPYEVIRIATEVVYRGSTERGC